MITENIILGLDLETERKINQGVAEFLMPKEYLEHKSWSLHEIYEFSKEMKVSPHAFVIRLFDLKLVSQDTVDSVVRKTHDNIKRKDQQSYEGGHYYNSKINRLGIPFSESVIIAAESGSLEFTRAFNLVNVRGKTYDKLKEELSL